MEATTLTPEPPSAAELRERISQLREQIQAVTVEYRLAKAERRSDRVAALLRQRSELTRLLFQAQRELFVSFRAPPGILSPGSDDASQPAIYSE